MRIDKLLADSGFGTRSAVKKILKSGQVTVNDIVITHADYKVSPDSDRIVCLNQTIKYQQYEYFLLNKPAGYVCARKDNVYPTVMELLPETMCSGLFPVGRLDADTEGLLLITNDGGLAHRLLSPKRHVDKVYDADIDGIVCADDVNAFAAGLDIGDEKPTLPAFLSVRSVDNTTYTSKITVTLHEGRFHQVKRMFHAVGKEVTHLKRTAMGSLSLDESLAVGTCRRLTQAEIDALKHI